MVPGKKFPLKKKCDISTRKSVDNLPEVALAAIASSKKQKEVSEFLKFLLAALDKNSDWLNNVITKQPNFRCALMVGAGPNRFHLQEIIYPSDDKDIKLEVELKESEDYDKIAIAALLHLSNSKITHLLNYIKTRLDSFILREELQQGKSLGVSYAVLTPFAEKQYRVLERIVIGSSMKCVLPIKRKRDEQQTCCKSRLLTKKTKCVA